MQRGILGAGFIWQSYLLIGICAILASLWPMQAAICALLIFLFDTRLHTASRTGVCLIIFAALFLISSITFHEAKQVVSSPPSWLVKGRHCGEVVRTQGFPENRLRITLRDLRPAEEGQENLPGLCIWTWDEPLFEPLPGQTICLSRRITAVSGFANSRAADYEAARYGAGIYWRMWSKGATGEPEALGTPNRSAIWRNWLRERFISHLWKGGEALIPQSSAILPALLFGDRSFLSQATIDDFSSASIAHSLALSGQHLAIAGSFGIFIVFIISIARPGLFLAVPRKHLALYLALPLAIIYLWIGNAPVSLQRAGAMLCLAAFLMWRGLPFTGVDLLCGALLLILAPDPLAVFDTGLQLSALCVGVIILVAKPVCRCTNQIKNPVLRSLARIFLVSILIQIVLLPVTLIKFQLAGIWFALNILWLPLLGLIVLPLAALGLCFCSLPGLGGLADWALYIAAQPCQLILYLLRLMRNAGVLAEPAFLVPLWPNLLAFALLAVSIALLTGITLASAARKGCIMACLALCFMGAGPLLRLAGYFYSGISLEILDVGQGQSVLLRLPGGKRLLVDGGGSYTDRFDPGRFIVAPFLAGNAVPYLEAVANSHPDLDHLGGLFFILDKFKIGALYHNGREAKKPERWKSAQEQNGARALAAGDKIVIGDPSDGLALEVLHPPREGQWEGNGASLVMRLTRNGEGLVLFTGDADKNALKRLLAEYPDLRARVVMAPHHGSDKNMLPAFYRACAPELVVASCGYLNRWKYPGQKLAAWLEAQGIPLLDTGRNGRITVELDDQLKIRTVEERR